MVSFSLRLRISYLLLQDSSLVSFHLIQFAQKEAAEGNLTDATKDGKLAKKEALVCNEV